ncbi:glycosyltransferase family 4 protein [Conexibacter sp. DBS9H8]|uniref:glycosyltransferase family 4 protein n=1 Tax=Conexibacter sp. DBS9H8 TaxID=2937801 RepID=UPI0020108F73|nr:glycosyltransferase family 4 protein [Conexibacter sp. DBS9H8]
MSAPPAGRVPDHLHPLRVTVVMPVAAPYREGLFRSVAADPRIRLRVVYLDARQPSWDVPAGYFHTDHPYPAVHLRSSQLPRRGRTPVMVPRGIRAALRAGDPEVIVASEYGPAALVTRAWAARRGVPHLLLTECTAAVDDHISGLQRRLQHAFARRVDGAIAVSSPARQRLLELGLPADRVAVALQAAELAHIRAARSTREAAALRGDRGTRVDEQAEFTPAVDANGAASALRVLSVARLVPDKNLALLLRAAAQAAAELPRPVTVDVVGEGFLRSRLEALAGELPITVTFHGHRHGPELAALYAAADVFVLLSAYEPFGVVIREAAAAGLPIITTSAVGAAPDVARDGANARLVPPGDLSAAVVALTRVLGDPATAGQMAAASLTVDAETAGGEAAAFIEAILAAARRHGRQPAAAGHGDG